MKHPTILELRGNGALVRVCSFGQYEFKELKEAAVRYGEELSMAWFDPAFRWKTNVRAILDDMKVLSEYRGLLMDDRSFLEIRRYGRTRIQYRMKELLGDGLLFPMVQFANFQPAIAEPRQTLVLEITYGTGCLARFEADKLTLSELELLTFSHAIGVQQLVLFSKYGSMELVSCKDDFLVRRSVMVSPTSSLIQELHAQSDQTISRS